MDKEMSCGINSRDKTDVNLSRSGLFDTGYGGLDDATSSEGR